MGFGGKGRDIDKAKTQVSTGGGYFNRTFAAQEGGGGKKNEEKKGHQLSNSGFCSKGGGVTSDRNIIEPLPGGSNVIQGQR